MIAPLLDPASYALRTSALPLFAVGSVLFLLGVVALLAERGSAVSVTFCGLVSSATVWLMGYAAAFVSIDDRLALWWVKVAQLGVVWIPTMLVVFASTVTRRRPWRVAIWGATAASSVFSLAVVASTSFVSGLYHYTWGAYARYGPATFLFLPFFFSAALASLGILRSAYREAIHERSKRRLRLLLIALAVAYLASWDYLPAYGIAVYPFGSFAIAAFFLLTAWTLWRYQLVDLTPAFAAPDILQTMSDALFVVDLDGGVQFVNRAACDLFGLSSSTVLGRPLASAIGGRLDAALDPTAILVGSAVRVHETVWQRGTGQPVALSVSASVIVDRRRSPIGLIYTAVDVTERQRAEALEREQVRLEAEVAERQRAEAVLRESEERFRAFMNNSPAVAFMKDEAGRYAYVNAPFEHQFQMRLEDWVGKTDRDVWPPAVAAELQAHDARVLSESRTLELVERVPTPDGRPHDWLVFKFPVTDPAGHRFVGGIAVDITDRKQAERLKHELLDVLSHELRIPLTTAEEGVSQVLDGVHGVMTSAQRECLAMVAAEHERLRALIDKTVRVTEIMTGKVDVVRAPIDAVALLQDVASSLRPLAHAKGVTLDVRSAGTVPSIGDHRLLTEALRELVQNAIHVTESQGRVSLSCAGRAEGVELAIHDTGPGIPEEDLPGLFEQFHWVGGTDDRKTGGMGWDCLLPSRSSRPRAARSRSPAGWDKALASS